MKRWIMVVAIFLLGFAANQVQVLLKPQFSQLKKPVEVSTEATATAVFEESKERETAIVLRVIDGDTVELADGRRVRYIGIDTPEMVHPDKAVECGSRQAMEENKRLVDGKTVRLEKDVSEVDKYGRLLRYVWAGDVMVNDYLVRQGFAHASTYPPDVAYSEQFVAAEREAREAGRGVWNAKNCP